MMHGGQHSVRVGTRQLSADVGHADFSLPPIEILLHVGELNPVDLLAQRRNSELHNNYSDNTYIVEIFGTSSYSTLKLRQSANK